MRGYRGKKRIEDFEPQISQITRKYFGGYWMLVVFFYQHFVVQGRLTYIWIEFFGGKG